LGLAFCALWSPSSRAGDEPTYTRTEDVVYGRKHGTALTLDVFTPKKNANGAAVVWMVSGGWFSSHDLLNGMFLPFVTDPIDHGYTVFAVVHGSQPKFTIPEVIADTNRAVRFIRYHAQDYKIDPDRIGVSGGSAGGHLSLMLGTASGPGDPKAKDPIDRVSSRVQAVACFFPPTDFLNYGKPGENALGQGVLADFKAAFDFHELNERRHAFVPVVDHAEILKIGRDISPVYHVTPDDPPTLIIHGDKDLLVPIQQSKLIVEKLKKNHVEAKLVVKSGEKHGWPKWDKDMAIIVDWFDQHLKPYDKDKSAGDR
jgi:acetyl esterase/lipase